jgi:hypothetical protein
VAESIHWDPEDAAYISCRSTRYPGARDIDPAWTQEALADPDLVAFEPDPKSRLGASRFIGESPGADAVLVVIAYRDLGGALHGINAWPATGPDLQIYATREDEGDDDGEDG